MKTAVLMTCHDRKAATVGCLARLSPQLGGGDKVFLVDDGSSDGTAEAVESAFPDGLIEVLHGDGSLYWAKGMRAAWDAAGDGWDCYLWLNDDTELSPGALSRLASFVSCPDEPRVVVGELVDAKGAVVYGSRPEDLFTGNCLLVTRGAAERVGRICGDFAHAWADSDYAMRCRREDVPAVSAGVVGRAEGHPNRPSLRGKSLKARCRLLFDPKGWNLHDLWLYRRRNWGVAFAVASCIHMAIRVLLGDR